jgi:hypothetical protein
MKQEQEIDLNRAADTLKLGQELEVILNKYVDDKKVYVADFLTVLGCLYVGFVADAAIETPPDVVAVIKKTSADFITGLLDERLPT